jgi:hypothetical protein
VSARAHTTRSVVLSLAIFGLACTDAPTGTGDGGEERLVVSVVGVADSDAGFVVRLSDAVQSVEPARHSLDLAWSTDAAGVTTVAIVGTVAEPGDLLLVRRRATSEPLRAEVIEVASADGELAEAVSVRATVRLDDQ